MAIQKVVWMKAGPYFAAHALRPIPSGPRTRIPHLNPTRRAMNTWSTLSAISCQKIKQAETRHVIEPISVAYSSLKYLLLGAKSCISVQNGKSRKSS